MAANSLAVVVITSIPKAPSARPLMASLVQTPLSVNYLGFSYTCLSKMWDNQLHLEKKCPVRTIFIWSLTKFWNPSERRAILQNCSTLEESKNVNVQFFSSE
jgi:hypothetical protein